MNAEGGQSLNGRPHKDSFTRKEHTFCWVEIGLKKAEERQNRREERARRNTEKETVVLVV